MKRRKTSQVKIGRVKVGGNAPISIQSMTKVPTKEVAAAVAQIRRLERAGCEIIRLAVRDHKDARAFADIRKETDLPLVADIHFNYKLALEALENGAHAIRLNPGNIRRKHSIEIVARMAKERNVPIRIGINSGSVEKKSPSRSRKQLPLSRLMVESACRAIDCMERTGFNKILVSLKSSDVKPTIDSYRLMAAHCSYPFHLGITAAGPVARGSIKSAIGIGALLLEGIGDTIRVSLTGDPVEEVKAEKEILSALALRSFGPVLISCPACGRCEIDLPSLVKKVEVRLADMRTPLRIAVMGCVVNGPGESRDADIGIAWGKGKGLLFKKGKPLRTVKASEMVDVLVKEVKRWDRG